MIYPWHQSDWQQLAAHWRQLPHALLFSGRENTGKTAFARHLAATLLCEQATADRQPCGQCPSCHLFAQNSHPDFYELTPEIPEGETVGRKLLQIKIDAVRGLIEHIQLTSVRGGKRVILIHPAEVGARPVEPAAKACAVHEGQVRGVLLGREQALFGFGVQLALPFLPGRGEVEAEGGRGDCARFIGAAVAGTAPRAGNSRIRGRVYRNRTSGGVRTSGTSARLQNRPGRNACALGRTGSSLPRSPCGPFSRETTGTALSRRVAHAARAVSGKTSRSIPGHPGHSVPVHAARFMLHHATYGRRFGQNIASDGT